jgi:hypothetical protein
MTANELDEAKLEIDKLKLEIERRRLEERKIERRWELAKWGLAGMVAIIGFLMIKPREQERLDLTFKRDLLKDYISAKDKGDPNLWTRKIELINVFIGTKDERLADFVRSEMERVAKALKLETDKVATDEAKKMESNKAELAKTEIAKIDKKVVAAGIRDAEKNKLMADKKKFEQQKREAEAKYAAASIKAAQLEKELIERGVDTRRNMVQQTIPSGFSNRAGGLLIPPDTTRRILNRSGG